MEVTVVEEMKTDTFDTWLELPSLLRQFAAIQTISSPLGEAITARQWAESLKKIKDYQLH